VKLVKLAAAVVNTTPLAWDANQRVIVAAIEAARAEQVSVLCLPEMCISGYGCEDAFHAPGTHLMAMRVLHELAPHSRGMVVSVGLPVFHHKALYNAACLLVDGRIVGFAAKRFLAGDGLHYEPRWFKAWPSGARGVLETGDAEYPIGDLYFDVGGVSVGFEICEDAWVANRPGSSLSLRGVDVILNPSASHFAFGKFGVRQRFVTEGSRAFGVAYVYANLLGNEAGRIVYDGGALIASGGELVARGSRFSFADFEITSAVIDVVANRMELARRGSYQPELDQGEAGEIEVPFAWPVRDPEPQVPRAASWEDGASVKEEEFARAISLALFDYLRKSRSRGFVVSLSGGADSAAVSCLAALMVHLGRASIGPESLAEKLAYIDGLAGADQRALVGRLLTCAYQATRNSSDTTRNAARAVAEAIGATFHELDVDALVRGYVSLIEGAVGRALTWDTDDITLQNIQARARAPSVWMLANLEGKLLLATSNRSEAAVGYATMDGDTAGGVSPIAGIDKAFLRRWLRWLEREGPEGYAVPALAAVNVQQPTAELRPPEAEQTDEGDLMPYELLDAIEGSAIRDKHTPFEVFLEMRARFPQFAATQLVTWIERFFRLWCRNQWKRERYAPSFHVDDKNLDPKTWCRFPILSGGYERELAELRAWVERGGPEPTA
jgi:NAD+ synthase (glutamine-hydrolysing)